MSKIINSDTAIEIRRAGQADAPALLEYLHGLSPQTRSYFAPHPYDDYAVRRICNNEEPGVMAFVAAIPESGQIIAYALVKKGFTEGERYRFGLRNEAQMESNACLYAPSVSDQWQGRNLGTSLFEKIREELFMHWQIRWVVLWGGVQLLNEKAVRYYRKLGFTEAGIFFHEGKDNLDMVLDLSESKLSQKD